MKWQVDKYNRNAGYVSEHGQALLELLSPSPGEVILDVGCGDGELAEKIKDDKVAAKLKDQNGCWFADYVRCRFSANRV